MSHIPVSFVNTFTRHRLAQAALPALSATGDDAYLDQLGYEVVNCEWLSRSSREIEIVVTVQPQLHADVERPLSYLEA